MEFLSVVGTTIADWFDRALFGLSPTGRIMLAIGIFGQAMFVSRWFVQWLASEKARRSIVPELFWYLSLFGGLMVLSYGIYSANLVLILGQFGVFIYARNIYLIRRNKADTVAEVPGDPADHAPEKP
ncbi:MAG: lipid-A-disaccharide synthase N-terminal domain-containing protein [Pseudomonadota bacterium]